jgi:transposase-like protein
MTEKKYCESCGIEEEEYGFDFDMDKQGEYRCQECMEELEEEELSQ